MEHLQWSVAKISIADVWLGSKYTFSFQSVTFNRLNTTSVTAISERNSFKKLRLMKKFMNFSLTAKEGNVSLISWTPLCMNIDLGNKRLRNRSSHWTSSVKKGILKNFISFTGKRLRWSLFLIKLQAFRSVTLSKRDTNTGVFPKTSILNNICERLLLKKDREIVWFGFSETACFTFSKKVAVKQFKPYKHTTCISLWNDLETVVSTSFQREIHVVCL